MSKVQGFFAALCFTVSAATAVAAEPPVVVELFTSEGCSSCPPADALLAELARQPGVLALSYHVDYWDRLGWKDPYSSAAATARQQHYARLLGVGRVYTPQIVVDGRWQAVGSDRSDVEQALAAARRASTAVPVALALDHRRARIGLGASGVDGGASVLLVAFDRHHDDAVERGENAGRTLTHVDVVRGFAEIGRADGDAQTIAAPIPWQADRIAAILQAADGHILGVAIADLTER